MTVFERLATDYLRGKGCFVYPAGTPDPAEPVVAAKSLRDAGFRVFAPGVDLPVPPITLADARVALESQKFTVLEPGEEPIYGLDRAAAALKTAGYKVFPPEQPPKIGWWVPNDKAIQSRHVVGVDGSDVLYRQEDDLRRCRIHTFASWERKTKARLELTSDITSGLAETGGLS